MPSRGPFSTLNQWCFVASGHWCDCETDEKRKSKTEQPKGCWFNTSPSSSNSNPSVDKTLGQVGSRLLTPPPDLTASRRPPTHAPSPQCHFKTPPTTEGCSLFWSLAQCIPSPLSPSSLDPSCFTSQAQFSCKLAIFQVLGSGLTLDPISCDSTLSPGVFLIPQRYARLTIFTWSPCTVAFPSFALARLRLVRCESLQHFSICIEHIAR